MHFGHDHDGEDGNQHRRHARPLEQVQRGIEHHAHATGTDDAQDGRFTHVDVPAQQHDGHEGGLQLRPVAIPDLGELARARRLQRLDGAARHLLDGLAGHLADEADRAESDGQRARQRTGSEDGQEQQRPHQRIDRAAGHQHDAGEQVQAAMAGQVGRHQQAKGNGQHDGEQGTERSDVQGLDQSGLDVAAEVGPVDGPHAGEHVAHLLGRIVEELGDDLDVAQRLHHGQGDDQPHGETQEALQGRMALPFALGRVERGSGAGEDGIRH